MTLDDIGRAYGTDKSSIAHDYCRKYEKYLPFDQHNELNIMEIGVLGGQSLKMWKQYFYNSHILGIDISPSCKIYEENNIGIEIGSQTDEEFLKHITNKYGAFDIILDDGSHMCSDVIYSFEHLFESVKSGGIYVIEDVCTSYWELYEGGRYKKGTVIEYFKRIVDEVNFFGEYNESTNYSDRRDDILIDQFKRKGYNYSFQINHYLIH